jgi:hypothetical protein
MRRFAFAILLLLAGGAVARSAENLTPETLLPGLGASDASSPAMAYGNGGYLLVWQAGGNPQAAIVGLRLDKAGKPQAQEPFVISSARDVRERPKVVFGGGTFLVVWHDLRNGKHWDVYAARVPPQGRPLDVQGIAVTRGARNQCDPDVCWDGAAFQVLCRGFQGQGDEAIDVNRRPAAGYLVYGARVSPQGKLLDDPGVLMARPPREYLVPQSMGTSAAVLLRDGSLLAAARTGVKQCLWRIKDGKPASDPLLLAKCGGFDGAAFASSGKSVLLVWTTFRDGGGRSSGTDKSGLLVLDADGGIGTAEARSLSSLNREPRVRHPSPAWDGKRYVVAWDVPRAGKEFRYEALLLRCFAADGAPLGGDLPVVDEPGSPAYWPAVASDGAGTTAIAYERHPEKGDTPIRIGVRMLRADTHP